MSGQPSWITEAARRWLTLEEATRAARQRGHHSANGSDEHFAYVAALRTAYQREGLPLKARDMNGALITPSTPPMLLLYGTNDQRNAVYVRVIEAAREIGK